LTDTVNKSGEAEGQAGADAETADDLSSSTIQSDAFKRSVSACTRAVAHDHALNVEFVEGDFAFDARSSKLADVPDNPTGDHISQTRGHSDSVALYHHLHDADIHRKHQPNAFAAQTVFAMAEQLRCEAHGSRNLPGVQLNLDAGCQYAAALCACTCQRFSLTRQHAYGRGDSIETA